MGQKLTNICTSDGVKDKRAKRQWNTRSTWVKGQRECLLGNQQIEATIWRELQICPDCKSSQAFCLTETIWCGGQLDPFINSNVSVVFAPESVQSVCYTTLSNVGSLAHSFPLLGGAGSPEQPILGQRGLQAHTFPMSFQHFSSHFCRNYLISLITDMGTHHFPFGNYPNFAFHTFPQQNSN